MIKIHSHFRIMGQLYNAAKHTGEPAPPARSREDQMAAGNVAHSHMLSNEPIICHNKCHRPVREKVTSDMFINVAYIHTSLPVDASLKTTSRTKPILTKPIKPSGCVLYQGS